MLSQVSLNSLDNEDGHETLGAGDTRMKFGDAWPVMYLRSSVADALFANRYRVSGIDQQLLDTRIAEENAAVLGGIPGIRLGISRFHRHDGIFKFGRIITLVVLPVISWSHNWMAIMSRRQRPINV